MEKKKNTYMLTVIAIATLLVAVVGATYAYFTASVSQSGNNSTSATAAKLASLNMDVSELRKIDKGIYPGWVGYQKITITAPEGTQDGAVAKYNLTMKSTNGFDASTATDNLTYKVYACTKDKVCTSLEEDDIYTQGELKVEDILDNESNPTGTKKYYFSGASFSIAASETDYTNMPAVTLPNTGSNSSNINEEVTFKKGNTHVYYIVYTFKNIESEQDALQGKTFTAEFSAEVGDINETSKFYLYNEIAKNSLGTGSELNDGAGINYSAISSNTNGKGVYTIESTASDTYPVYFYRGEVDNNHVLFNNICWRAVRTTSTGGVKLIYDGLPSSGKCNNTGDATQLADESDFNIISNKPEYVGWKYTEGEYHGTDNPSIIYGVVKDWYDNNMVGVQTKLENTIWCNDRRAYSSENSIPGTDNEMTYSASSNAYYAPIIRAYTLKRPSLECPNSNDQFPGYYGLITSDEVMYAGGVFGTENTSYYLKTGSYYWTMSPVAFNNSPAYVVTMLHVSAYGDLDNLRTNIEDGVRPMVSLNSSATISGGNGSSGTPYVIN